MKLYRTHTQLNVIRKTVHDKNEMLFRKNYDKHIKMIIHHNQMHFIPGVQE